MSTYELSFNEVFFHNENPYVLSVSIHFINIINIFQKHFKKRII